LREEKGVVPRNEDEKENNKRGKRGMNIGLPEPTGVEKLKVLDRSQVPIYPSKQNQTQTPEHNLTNAKGWWH
jgi:hypothetical protein